MEIEAIKTYHSSLMKLLKSGIKEMYNERGHHVVELTKNDRHMVKIELDRIENSIRSTHWIQGPSLYRKK